MNPILPVFKIIPLLGALLAAPLIPGLINKVKAAFAGRRGPPVLQLYFDLFKLIQRGAVFSRTTTSLLAAGPLISLVSAGFVLLFIPWGPLAAPLAFEGDLILVVALLGLGRFMTVLSALDTGSSFEAMGASREVQFAAPEQRHVFHRALRRDRRALDVGDPIHGRGQRLDDDIAGRSEAG